MHNGLTSHVKCKKILSLVLLMSNEIHCHLDGMMNNRTVDIGLLKIQENFTKDHCRIKKSGGLLVKSSVIASYFFEDSNENIVTVNSKRYIEIINNFFVLELRWKRIPIQRV